MEAPDGYTLQKCLSLTPRQWIYRALRERDGCEVVLKAYPTDRPNDPAGAALREFEALRAIEPGCGVRALDLVRTDGPPVLVLEDFPGVPPRALLELPAFLSLAVRSARALAGVHRARWLHRSLAPERLLVHPVTGDVRLAGFERAAPLGAPAESALEARLALPLLYAAPEQSGRTERGVDARSDLYALGAVFYELLLGLPPFDSTDPLELIHAHVAKRPTPPLEHRPELPATLARITLRLLEKEPEDRYQTAEAVAVDLESALEQLTRTGRIDDEMPLATADMPYRPLFRRAVYGRERELESLLGAYRRAARGTSELVLVRGVPGIGKSALVPELHRPLAEDGGYLAQGKFDLYRRHVPYSGFSSAFACLAEQILSESETRVRGWQETLTCALGPLSGVIAELGPPLRTLLAETPPPPPLGPSETQQRLGLAVQRLLRAAAERAHPLVLFLDDLQWVDSGSLFLLEEVLRNESTRHLLVIAAYRQNEVDAGHPFARLLERLAQASKALTVIELGPLAERAAAELLASALGTSPDQALGLASTLVRKSGNNPLLLQQCVYHLHHLGVIHFERGHGWRWDAAQAAAAELPDDPASMLATKLEWLPRELREALQLASCVGDRFSLELLLELSRLERKPLEAALHVLCDEGLIAPAREGFRFVHDRIREAAQAQLSERERSLLHAEAASLLLAKTPESELDERALEIADHLILSVENIGASERASAIDVHMRAGSLALRSGAAASAARYFTAAEDLFVESDWRDSRERSFSLFMRSIEAAYQMGELARAEQLLDRLQARPLSDAQELNVTFQRITVLTLTRPEQAFALTLATLRRLGLRWPKSPSWLRLRLAILYTDWLLRGSLETRTLPKFNPSAERLARGTATIAGGRVIATSSPGLVLFMAIQLMRWTLDSGGMYPGINLATYSTYRIRYLRDLTHAKRYAKVAELWLKLVPRPRAHYGLWAFHYGWWEPRQRVASSLLTLAETLGESGDVEYRGYTLGASFSYQIFSGRPVTEIAAQLEAFPRACSTDAPMLNLCELTCRRIMQGRMRSDLRQAPPWPESVDPKTSFRPAWLQDTMVLCIYNEYAAAIAHAEAAIRYAFSIGSVVAYVADCLMFRGISEAALAQHSTGRVRRSRQRSLDRCLAQLRRWMRHAPDAVHMHQLLTAERARLAGHADAALRGYSAAAERACERGFRHHAALADERRAELLKQLDRTSEWKAALQRAIDLYREWGAHRKVQILEATRDGGTAQP